MGGWGGWFPNKVRTPQNPPKSPWKILTQISPFLITNLTKTMGCVGGFTHLGKLSQKNVFLRLPLLHVWAFPTTHEFRAKKIENNGLLFVSLCSNHFNLQFWPLHDVPATLSHWVQPDWHTGKYNQIHIQTSLMNFFVWLSIFTYISLSTLTPRQVQWISLFDFPLSLMFYFVNFCLISHTSFVSFSIFTVFFEFTRTFYCTVL